MDAYKILMRGVRVSSLRMEVTDARRTRERESECERQGEKGQEEIYLLSGSPFSSSFSPPPAPILLSCESLLIGFGAESKKAARGPEPTRGWLVGGAGREDKCPGKGAASRSRESRRSPGALTGKYRTRICATASERFVGFYLRFARFSSRDAAETRTKGDEGQDGQHRAPCLPLSHVWIIA
jgi:hypothetical protein